MESWSGLSIRRVEDVESWSGLSFRRVDDVESWSGGSIRRVEVVLPIDDMLEKLDAVSAQ